MKNILLSCSLLFASFSFGQSDKHLAAPGTNISLIPPEGFTSSSTFQDFQHEKANAFMVVAELPAPLQAIGAGGGKSAFIQLSQQANGQTYRKQVLLFGNSRRMVMVNGIYPEAGRVLDNAIGTALVSTAYREGPSEDSLQTVKFRISVDGTPFRYARSVTGSLLYTTDGEVPTRAADKAAIVVANSAGKVAATSRRQFSIDRLKKLPRGHSIISKTVTTISIAQLNGYEIVAEGRDASRNKQLVYQVTLFDEQGGYYLFVGTTIQNFTEHLAHFRTIVQTLQFK
jgi:hypothetical protein